MRVLGKCCDLVYPAGTVLLCVPPVVAAGLPPAPKRHLVMIEIDDGQTFARVRELRAAATGEDWAWSMSSMPTAPRPIRAPASPLADEWPDAARLVGVVIGSYRPE